MKHTTSSILAITTLALAACAKEEPVAPAPGPSPATEVSTTTTDTDTDTYPLNNCVVSGEPLGSMGDPIVVEHAGTIVKLCCKTCLPKFNADPESYTAKVK